MTTIVPHIKHGDLKSIKEIDINVNYAEEWAMLMLITLSVR